MAMGFKSLHTRADAIDDAVTILTKKQDKTGKDMNKTIDMIHELREKVQSLIIKQDRISNQFKNVDNIPNNDAVKVKESASVKQKPILKKIEKSSQKEVKPSVKLVPSSPKPVNNDEKPAADSGRLRANSKEPTAEDIARANALRKEDEEELARLEEE